MRFAIRFCLAILLFGIFSTAGEETTNLVYASDTIINTGPYPCENNLIEIMFMPESEVRMRQGRPADLKGQALEGMAEILGRLRGFEWSRICDVPEETLDRLHSEGQAKSGQVLYNLNNIYRLRIEGHQDIWEIARQLEELPGIMLARPVPLPTPLPVPGSFQPNQGYEDPAVNNPSGIDAEYAWTQPGGTGTGVTICDLEYGWNLSHQDLPLSIPQINPNPIGIPAGNTDDHGTAVLGELASLNNGWGTTGICYGATVEVCGTFYGSPLAWNVPGALAYAMASLTAGDIILLEQQWDYSNPGTAHPDYIPIEWWVNYHPGGQTPNGVYVAIQTAVANGIIVVEAGGNGGAPHTMVGIDTDLLGWYGNSGAIIVGAGGAYAGGTYPEGNLQKLNFSSYGNRFNLQGWGENVVTLGYNDLYAAEGKNLWYTSTFAGTSSAAPIVAGAAACCLGYWQANVSATPPSPAFILTTLINTGTAQITPPVGNIGPRPNLLAAFAQLNLSWTDVTTSTLGFSGANTAAAWGDYDNDGDIDLYLGQSMTANKLLRNDGGGVFTDVTSGPLGDADYANGLAWADYDNDGDLDLYLAKSVGNNKLFRNDGGGTFADATTSPLDEPGQSNSCAAWGDYDNDGLVDLYVCRTNGANRLFRNLGGGSFSDVTSGPEGDPGISHGCVWGDYNNDGDLDIYVANYNIQPNHLYKNNAGVFTDVTSGPLGGADNSVGVTWGDYDNDLDFDLFICNATTANKLLRNDGGNTFTDVTVGPLGGLGTTYCAGWSDYDNDGDLDIYLTNVGQANKLLRNDGGGVFTDATSGPLGDAGSGLSMAWGDYDGDGDEDIYLCNYGSSNKLFRNEVGSQRHWLEINLVGTVSNRSAIGAQIRLHAPGLNQLRQISGGGPYYSQSSLTAHFGLGAQTAADSIVISWPSGIIQKIGNTPADQVLTITESSFNCDCTPGETDGIAPLNILDVIYLINFKFKGGTAPTPYALCNGDPNCDCVVNILDIVYMIDYKFKGGPAPCDCPGWVTACGLPLRK